MARSIHLTNSAHSQFGCKTASKHIGAYVAVELAQFIDLPAEWQCQRCKAGRVFALWTKDGVDSRQIERLKRL